MSELERLGIESWFRLGDRDLAVHVYRTCRLNAGRTLSSVTSDLSRRFGVAAKIVPMSDDCISTMVETSAGSLSFQDYFVRHRCQPAVTRIFFENAGDSRPSTEFTEALEDPELAGIVICPSNPYLSIDPILSVPGVAEAIAASRVPVVAVTPVVQGRSIKGPTAKIMEELGFAASALSVAEHYVSLIDAFVLDSLDGSIAQAVSDLGIGVELANTVMHTPDDRNALASRVVELLLRLRKAERQ
jgi:LPPG:FO 2-phospho-L-lactate transferase